MLGKKSNHNRVTCGPIESVMKEEEWPFYKKRKLVSWTINNKG